MANIELTLACEDYDRTRALKDGLVKPEGIDLNYVALPVEEIFWRMLHFHEFDAAEMSMGRLPRGRLPRPPAVHRHPGVPVAHVPAPLHLRQRGFGHRASPRT